MKPSSAEASTAHFVHRLNARCPSRMRARVRPRPLQKRGLGFGDPTGITFRIAAMRVPASLHATLIAAGGLLEARGLERNLLRTFLLAATAPNADADHINDGVYLAGCAGFLALHPLEQR